MSGEQFEQTADDVLRTSEWLTVGELDVDHLLAEHRAAVEALRGYRRRVLELVAERNSERDRLECERRVSADLERQLDEALAVIARAGIDHGHDVARLLELEAELERLRS